GAETEFDNCAEFLQRVERVVNRRPADLWVGERQVFVELIRGWVAFGFGKPRADRPPLWCEAQPSLLEDLQEAVVFSLRCAALQARLHTLSCESHFLVATSRNRVPVKCCAAVF